MTHIQPLRIAPGIIWRALDGNAVLLAPISGNVRVLNGIGTIIWKQLAEGRAPEDIRSDLLAGYDATPEQVDADLDEFLAMLLAEEMLLAEAL